DRALVPVDAHVVGAFVGVAVGGRLPAAGLIAGVGALDLDHFRTEVAQLHRAEGTGENARGIEYGQSVERPTIAVGRARFAGHAPSMNALACGSSGSVRTSISTGSSRAMASETR